MIHYNLICEDNIKLNVFDFSYRKLIHDILKEIKQQEHVNSEHVVSFIIVNSEHIHEINKTYRHIDRSTDVISFAGIDAAPLRILPYELGDIYINIDKVFEQARSYGHSVKREFDFLITHGMFHLLGYDHMKKEEEIIMFKKQDDILLSLGINR
jgi:probable rRNA maturation factor